VRGWLAGLLSPPQRATALPVVAVLIGLLCGGVAVFRGGSRPVVTVPPGYVALVNQKGVLMSDFMAQVAAETTKPFEESIPAERAKVLGEMIDEELLVQRGLLLDLPETTIEVRTAMVDAVNAQADAPAMAYEPGDQELRSFYETNRAHYSAEGTMTLRDLVLHVGGYQNANQTVTQATIDATEAVYQLRAGATVDYVIAHFGLVDTGRGGTDALPDFAAKIRLGAKLYAVAATLTDGMISEPVEDADGLHILVMQHRLPPRPAEFSSVRDKVYADFREAQRTVASRNNLANLRGQAHVLLAPGQTLPP
jgi:hypothetical protein